MRRWVYLLCFGPDHELLTVRQEPGAEPALPRTRRRERETYVQAASRLMTACTMRPGDAVARIGSLPLWSPAGRCEIRVFTGHTRELFPVRAGGWEPWEDVLPRLAHPVSPELALFAKGYVRGWIPDGWTTLDP
ncbi:hypothetical protein ACIQZN_25285 [Streptomyces sp. NPDC097595]|uniref:hypothetical protein n=1 Tax=Streptomyces sp. NPDC097595 TaxID=3366090 RepID=UPI0038034035